jgi:hypothetical protein
MHDSKSRRPMMIGEATLRASGPWDWPAGPTAHYDEDFYSGLATRICMMSEQDSAPYQEYGYARRYGQHNTKSTMSSQGNRTTSY